MKGGVLIQIFRDAEPVVKINGAADDLTFGKVQTMEHTVAIELPEGKLGVICRIQITKGPILLVLREAAKVVKQGGYGGDPAVVFRKAKTRADPFNSRADSAGMFLL
jgi:hypothetical protein